MKASELAPAIEERDRLARVIANYVTSGEEVPIDLIRSYREAKFAVVDVIHHPSCPLRTQHVITAVPSCACREAAAAPALRVVGR